MEQVGVRTADERLQEVSRRLTVVRRSVALNERWVAGARDHTARLDAAVAGVVPTLGSVDRGIAVTVTNDQRVPAVAQVSTVRVLVQGLRVAIAASALVALSAMSKDECWRVVEQWGIVPIWRFRAVDHLCNPRLAALLASRKISEVAGEA